MYQKEETRLRHKGLQRKNPQEHLKDPKIQEVSKKAKNSKECRRLYRNDETER